MRRQGTMRTWKDDQGYGFIAPQGGGEEVFAHIKSFADRNRRPVEGDRVAFEQSRDDRGRSRAENIEFLSGSSPLRVPSMRGLRPLAVPASFLAFVVGSAAAGQIPYAVLGLYLVASVVTFIAYAVDKSAAQNNRWRTKETTLHALSLVGGWPGAFAAQKLLHHKSSKQSFQLVFWGTVLINVGAFLWLFTPDGAAAFRDLVGSF